MIEQVKSRIKELEVMDEEQVAADEIRGEARAHTLTAESIARLQAKYGQISADEEEKPEDDARSVARSVLSDNANLKATHSHKSVTAIAQKKLATVGEEENSLHPKGEPNWSGTPTTKALAW